MKYYFSFFLLVVPLLLAGQDYSYTHYDLNSGLPGTNVYYIYQDRDGFMWFATEAGVCRYDGSRYKIFTLADGLPDIEVFGIYHDSHDRLWMLPFKKSICFYKDGKFYTPENTPYLGNIHVKNRLYGIAEDNENNIWLYEDYFLYKVSPDGTVTTISEVGGIAIDLCTKISRSKDGGILIAIKSGLYHLKDDKIKLVEKYNLFAPAMTSPLRWMGLSENMFVNIGIKVISYKYNRTMSVNAPGYNQSISILNDSIFFISTTKGAYRYSFISPSKKPEFFFVNKNVGYVYQDREQNLWFSVLGDGLYKLSTPEIKNFRFGKLKLGSLFSFHGKQDDNTFVCSSPGKIIFTKDFLHARVFPLDSSLHDSYTWPCKIKLIKKTRDRKNWIVIDDDGLEKYSMNFKRVARTSVSTKTVFDSPDNSILITSFMGLFQFNNNNLAIEDTLWKERTTSVFKSKDGIIYFGTLNGLYARRKNGGLDFMGDKNKLFRQRPSVLAETDDGSIVLGTYGNGLVCFNKKGIKFQLTQKNGLVNNIVTSVLPIGDEVWVGTTNGLNRIILAGNSYSITKFCTSDGLISNDVTSLFFKRDTLYVGTPEGINFFNIKKLAHASRCDLKVTKVLINGREVPFQLSYEIKPDEKDFRVELAGLSFKSETGTQYKYRLLGLFDDWRILTQNSLQLASLPYGQLKLQLVAINQYGVNSKPVTIDLDVFKPFYKTYFFIVLLVFLATSSVAGFIYWRYKRVRDRERQKELLNIKIIQLEQFALQAQMNPHFIFNCLSSLQHYIYDNNVKEGNRLLTRFASLIRQTLDNSSQIFITLADEVKYLSSYLEVEQIRFDHKFEFSISVDNTLPANQVKLPNMILQPFIENSLKHGIPNRENGKLTIHFYCEDDEYLICNVADNGVGREATELNKIQRGYTHTSKGLSVTTQRINLLNSILNGTITLMINDLKDTYGKARGTQVVVKIPMSLNLKF